MSLPSREGRSSVWLVVMEPLPLTMRWLVNRHLSASEASARRPIAEGSYLFSLELLWDGDVSGYPVHPLLHSRSCYVA